TAGTRMTDPVPSFFFSYSQADTDVYLDKFFEDLRKRVANLSGLAINYDSDADAQERLDQVGFRDSYGVKTREEWRQKIGKNMQRNGVLVCVYSPNFFSRRQDKQFCGREFSAFLSRNTAIYYVRGTGEPEREFRLEGARNILPIIWWPLQMLSNQKLPPYILGSIQWKIDKNVGRRELSSDYLKLGTRRIAVLRDVDYEDLLTHFADRIIKLAKDPLPGLQNVPDIESLRNAFWDQPEENKINLAKAAAAV